MKKIKLTLSIFMMCTIAVAQDIHFSQLNMTPLILNPANAGAFNGDQRVTLNYRDQWRSVAIPYTTFALAGDMAMLKSDNGHLGVGLQLYRDRAGDLGMGTTNAKASAAYHLKITSKQRLSAGLAGGMGQRSLDLTDARFGNQYDGTGHNGSIATGETFDTQNFFYGDFSGGILWSFSSSSSTISSKDGIDASAGVSFVHFNTPKRSLIGSDEELYSKIIGHAMLSYGIQNTNIDLQPSFYYFRQSTAQEFIGGLNIRYVLKEESKYTGLVKGAAVSLGGFYRLQDAVAVVAAIEYGSYTLSFGYDVNTSKLRTASNGRGGFEVAIRFTNPNPFLYKGTSGNVKFL